MIDLKEFSSAMEQIAEEKGISKDHVKEVIEQAIAAAYKKDYGEKGQVIQAEFDPKKGTATFRQVFTVVTPDMVTDEDFDVSGLDSVAEVKTREDDPKLSEEDEKVRFNPKRHIWLEEAQKKQKGIQPGEELYVPLDPHDEFGRIAAQTAKQVIIQRVREAEREATYEVFKEKEGELVSGQVQRVDRGVVHLDIGRTTGVLFPDEQIPGERYRQGQRVRVYVVRVEKETRGPAIVLSRRHPQMIARLFELEVPEVASGAVEIKAIAREAGSRSKIAVVSHDETVDPVGACVGQKGIRVTAVINELSGENIDIIAWDEDPEAFVANALSPARVLSVELRPVTKADEGEGVGEDGAADAGEDAGADEDAPPEAEKENEDNGVPAPASADAEARPGTAYVVVADGQLSLAIGRRGQNVRLAAKLTGWRIDVSGALGQKIEEGADEDVAEEVAVSQDSPEEQNREPSASRAEPDSGEVTAEGAEGGAQKPGD